MSEAYEIVYFRGKRMDRMTAQALAKMESKLGYQLTVMQGSYNAGRVSASAGTHDGGGVIDLAPANWEKKVRAGRSIGFAMWYRKPSEGPWPYHIHGVLIGNEKAAPSAKRQIEAYRNGRNGLVSNLRDYFWRPSPIPTYHYVVDKKVGISLHALQVDFINVIDGNPKTRNPARYRGRVVQKLLNRKNKAGLLVDGVIGPKTHQAWKNWERKVGGYGREGVPDRQSLRALFRWTWYYIR